MDDGAYLHALRSLMLLHLMARGATFTDGHGGAMISRHVLESQKLHLGLSDGLLMAAAAATVSGRSCAVEVAYDGSMTARSDRTGTRLHGET